jgi:hypothetical protein
VSERLVVKMSRGRPTVRLEAIPGLENHSATYATAARAAVCLDLGKHGAERSSPKPPPPRAPAIIRLPFMARGRL